MRIRARITRQGVLAVMLLASVALLLLGGRVSGPLRAVGRLALSPVGDAGMYVVTGARANVTRSDEPMSAEQLRAYEDASRALSHVMETQIAEYRTILADLRRFGMDISRQYAPTKELPCDLVPARVVADDPLPYGATRVVNAGSNRGAARGLCVLVTDRRKAIPENSPVLIPPQEIPQAVPARAARFTTSILVGRLGATGAYTARMHLVTAPSFATKAAIRRILKPGRPRKATIGGRVRTLSDALNPPISVTAVGSGTGLLVRDLPAAHNVAPGDWLVLPYDLEFWPVEVRIGSVRRIEPDQANPLYVKVHVRPAADLATLRNVYIVVPEGRLRDQDGRQ